MMKRLLCLAALAWPLAAIASHPLEGKVWDTQARRFLSAEEAYQRAAASRAVLLGEQHDSEAHHRAQLAMLEALAARGKAPALAMEQFDSEHQSALAKAQADGVQDAGQLADAGQLNRKGWRWPMYRELIAYAAARGWPLLAANLSRQEGRQIAVGEKASGLASADAAQRALIEDDIVRGHCGMRPPAERLAAIVEAQRARDARMATVLARHDGQAVLVTGAGHARRDRAVPRYLPPATPVLAIAYTEVRAGMDDPAAYDGAGFDLLWFTEGKERPDPCAQPLGGSAAPANPPTPAMKKETP